MSSFAVKEVAPHFKWVIVAVLFFARVSVGFQFQSVGSLASYLIDKYGVNYTEVGTLVGLHMLPGIFVALPIGFLSRKLGDKNLSNIGLMLMVISGSICALSIEYWQLIVGRIVGGTGAAIVVVIMTKMITDWFRGQQVFFGMSIYVIGWPIGIAIGLATQVSLAEYLSVDAVFHATSVIAALSALAIVIVYRDADATAGQDQKISNSLTTADYWLVCLIGAAWMLSNSANLVVIAFAPILLTETGLDPVSAGLITSALSWVAIVALPVAGYLSSKFSISRPILFTSLVIGTAAVFALPYSPHPGATLVLFGLFYSSASAVLAALPGQMLRPEIRGPGISIYWAWFYIGVPVSTALAGKIRDVTKGTESTILFAAILLVVCTGILAGLEVTRKRAQVRVV